MTALMVMEHSLQRKKRGISICLNPSLDYRIFFHGLHFVRDYIICICSMKRWITMLYKTFVFHSLNNHTISEVFSLVWDLWNSWLSKQNYFSSQLLMFTNSCNRVSFVNYLRSNSLLYVQTYIIISLWRRTTILLNFNLWYVEISA